MKLTLFAVLSGDRRHKRAVCQWANRLAETHEVTLMSPTWLRPRGLGRSVEFRGLGLKWKRRFQQLNLSDCVVYFYGGAASSARIVYQHASIHPGVNVLSYSDPLAVYRSWFSRERHFQDSLEAVEAATKEQGVEAIKAFWTQRTRGSLMVEDLQHPEAVESCLQLLETIDPTRESTFTERFAKRMALRLHSDIEEPALVEPMIDRLAGEVDLWFAKAPRKRS